MKKLILTAIICTFIASPVLANEFTAVQAKVIGTIIQDMDKMQGNSAAMDFLTDKRNCVEKSTTFKGLQECIDNFKPQQLESVVQK